MGFLLFLFFKYYCHYLFNLTYFNMDITAICLILVKFAIIVITKSGGNNVTRF